ncbi:MAG: phage minor capsid protein [Solirubrobacteraceae bacterium]
MTPEQSLLHAYERAATRIRAKHTAALGRGALGTAGFLEQQIQAVDMELRKLAKTTRVLPVAVVASEYNTGARLADLGHTGPRELAYAFSGAHTRVPRLLTQSLTGTLTGALQTIGRQTRDMYQRAALEEVTQGVIAGDTRRQTSRALADRLAREGSTAFIDRRGARWQLDTYSKMAVRTTTREARSAGTAQRMLETGQQLITISDHGTETEICKPYEGGTFALPGSAVPGYETIDQLPPFHPNAVVAGTRVDASRVNAGSHAVYDGPLVHLASAGGIRLAVTPHHPVLTARGWLPAHLLHEGDHVVRGAFGERHMAPGSDEHLDDRPPLVEQVFDAWAAAGLAASIPAAPADFHGDARHFKSQVDVVAADRLLLNDLGAAVAEHGNETSLVIAGSRGALLAGDGAAAHGVLGVGPAVARAAAYLDAGRSEAPAQGRIGDWEAARDLLHRLAAPVALDELVEVRRVPRWCGHVYDLQTGTGTYFANGLYTHNCQHVATPAAANLDALERELGLAGARDAA